MTSRNPVRVPAEEQAKAVLGAILAGLTAAGTAAADGGIAAAEWIGIAVAVLATYATVFGVGNAPAGRRRNDAGCVNLSPLLQALLIILAVLAILALGREVLGDM